MALICKGPSKRVQRIHAELERLQVCVETFPSGAARLRKGSCHLMVAGFECVSDDDLAMFEGGAARMQRLAAVTTGGA